MNSVNRIIAMALRYAYILRRSWPRLLELFYWPAIQMILWGLISKFFASQTGMSANLIAALLAAVLLWDVMFRSHLGVALVYFEEVYSRNLGHLYISPLRPIEHVASLIIISFFRTFIGVSVAALLAYFLYDFALSSLGLIIAGFYLCLSMMGWALGLMVSALVMRYGLGAESLAWVIIFALAPLCAVYYPVDILPYWAQKVAWFIPASHVFEGLRSVIDTSVISAAKLITAGGISIAYLGLAIWFYLYSVEVARKDGLLLQNGE